MKSPLLRRAAVAIGIGAVALAGIPAANAAETALTFDTWSSWTPGDGVIGGFGHPDTATYGQTITIPAGKHKVRWFRYYMQAGPNSGTMTMRGEVYGWDGVKATDEVAETNKKTLTVTAGDPTFMPVKFRVKGARVKPGEQYVLFATVSKDYETTDPNVWTQWPCFSGTDPLPGGNTVWINDTGDESQWTTVAWSGISSYDMGFQAKLR